MRDRTHSTQEVCVLFEKFLEHGNVCPIQSLDLPGNSFGYDGFAALGRGLRHGTCSVEELFLAHNTRATSQSAPGRFRATRAA